MNEAHSKHKKLAEKLEQLQNALQSSSDIKFTLSDELLKSEDERLQISKILVETEIKCNALQQQLEIQKFDSASKIACLENTVSDFEEEINSLKTNLFQEKDRRKMAEEKCSAVVHDLELAKNKLMVSSENYDKLSEKNEQLYKHLISLFKSKSTNLDHVNTIESIKKSISDLRKEIENPQNYDDPHLGTNHVRPSISEYDQLRIEQECHSNRAHFREEIDRIRSTYESQQSKMKRTINDMRSQLSSAKVDIREKQERICDLNSKLIIKKHQLQNLENEYNSVQNLSRTWIDRFRDTLDKWMTHIAEFLDDVSNADESVISEKMTEYVKKMLEDMSNAHHIREQQLCEAVQTSRNNIGQLNNKYQKLLTSFKVLRLHVQGDDTIEEVSVHSLDNAAIISQDDLTLTQLEIENMKLKDRLNSFNGKRQRNRSNDEAIKKLRDENQRMESQIIKLENFIERNLKKYKVEIQHMKYHVGSSLLQDKS